MFSIHQILVGIIISLSEKSVIKHIYIYIYMPSMLFKNVINLIVSFRQNMSERIYECCDAKYFTLDRFLDVTKFST
jgi:hypothetical protein